MNSLPFLLLPTQKQTGEPTTQYHCKMNMVLSNRFERIYKGIEENWNDEPLCHTKFPTIMVGDFVGVTLPAWGTCMYGQVIKIIPDKYCPESGCDTYEIAVLDTNKTMLCTPLEITSYFSPQKHIDVMKSIKDVQIAKDMEAATKLVISKVLGMDIL